MQGMKRGNGPKGNMGAIAAEVLSSMKREVVYIIGPGTTTRSIMEKLHVPHTLLGVDVVLNGQVIAQDANEQTLWELINQMKRPVHIIITPIGGQGHIFGRGNQQISPRIIKKAGKDGIMVVATKEKLFSLPSFQLYVDTGDDAVNQQLSGYIKVVTGYEDYMICPVKI
jgi:predicted polyphosphate/ATP-dependent NAD kinase